MTQLIPLHPSVFCIDSAVLSSMVFPMARTMSAREMTPISFPSSSTTGSRLIR